MLHMIKTYPVNCQCHQQCIHILNSFKSSLDQQDIDLLISFIKVELEGAARFTFPSGNTTQGMNMG